MLNTEHCIPGKDVPLETAIRRQQALSAARGRDPERCFVCRQRIVARCKP